MFFSCTKTKKNSPFTAFPPLLRAQTLPQTTVSITGHFIEASEQQLLGEVLRNPKTSEVEFRSFCCSAKSERMRKKLIVILLVVIFLFFFEEEICFVFVERMEQKKSFVYIPNTMNKSIPIHLCIQKESISAMTKSYHEHHHSISKIRQKVPDLLRNMGIYIIQFVKSNQLKKNNKKKGGGETHPNLNPNQRSQVPELMSCFLSVGKAATTPSPQQHGF